MVEPRIASLGLASAVDVDVIARLSKYCVDAVSSIKTQTLLFSSIPHGSEEESTYSHYVICGGQGRSEEPVEVGDGYCVIVRKELLRTTQISASYPV